MVAFLDLPVVPRNRLELHVHFRNNSSDRNLQTRREGMGPGVERVQPLDPCLLCGSVGFGQKSCSGNEHEVPTDSEEQQGGPEMPPCFTMKVDGHQPSW